MRSTVKKFTKRVLAGLLILAMFGGILPFYTLPAVASPGLATTVDYIPSGLAPNEDGYMETAFINNHWNYNFQARTITYYGNWMTGCVKDGEGFLPFTYFNSSNGQWLVLDTNDQWSASSGTVGSQGEHPAIRSHPTAGYATGIGYLAEYTGAVRFSFDHFSTEAAYNGFAIFAGDSMIWPTPGAKVGDARDLTGWYRITSETTTQEINAALSSFTYSCQKDEYISFVFKRGGDDTGYNYAEPRIIYGEASFSEGKRSTVAFQNENYPTYAGAVLLTNFGDGWGFGSFPRTDPSDFNLFSNMDDKFAILNRGKSGDGDQWHYGGLYIGDGRVILATGYSSVYCYTAPLGGELNIYVDGVTSGSGGEGSTEILFCIAKNDQMIWPTKGGKMDDSNGYADWFDTAANGDIAAATRYLNGANLMNVAVEVGDQIRYCFVTRSGHSSNVRNVTLSTAYANVRSTIPSPDELTTEFADNFPTLDVDENGDGYVVAYNNRWTFAAAPHGTTDFVTLEKLTGGRLLPGASPEEGSITAFHNNQVGALFSPGSGYDVAVGYTVRFAGKVELSASAMSTGGEEQSLRYIIYKNGEKVDGIERAKSADISAHKYTLSVLPGDVLYFTLSALELTPAEESGEAETPAAPVSTSLQFLPKVTYKETSGEVSLIGISMTLSSNFKVNFIVGANGLFADMDEYGVLVWREKQEDFDRAERFAEHITEGERQSDFRMRFTYEGIAAKEMTDTFYVRAYTVKDGKKNWGDVLEFSVVGYVKQLYGRTPELDTLLTDMLLYGEAAQEYFMYKIYDLPSAHLNPAQLAAASKVAYLQVDRLSFGPENVKNPALSRIGGFSLSLGSSIHYCVHVDMDESERGTAVLEVSSNYNMSGFTEYAVDEDGHVKANPLHAAEVGKLFYFRLRTERDGMTCYGPIVSYSVESYVSGIAAEGRSDMAKLSARLLNYGYSALTYATVAEK